MENEIQNLGRTGADQGEALSSKSQQKKASGRYSQEINSKCVIAGIAAAVTALTLLALAFVAVLAMALSGGMREMGFVAAGLTVCSLVSFTLAACLLAPKSPFITLGSKSSLVET